MDTYYISTFMKNRLIKVKLTPNLDMITANGKFLSTHHTVPTCSLARVSSLTGMDRCIQYWKFKINSIFLSPLRKASILKGESNAERVKSKVLMVNPTTMDERNSL
jgi:hypothetical protein